MYTLPQWCVICTLCDCDICTARIVCSSCYIRSGAVCVTRVVLFRSLETPLASLQEPKQCSECCSYVSYACSYSASCFGQWNCIPQRSNLLAKSGLLVCLSVTLDLRLMNRSPLVVPCQLTAHSLLLDASSMHTVYFHWARVLTAVAHSCVLTAVSRSSAINLTTKRRNRERWLSWI